MREDERTRERGGRGGRGGKQKNKSKEQQNEREMDRDEQKVNQRKTYRSKMIPTKSSHCVVSRSKSQWTTREE